MLLPQILMLSDMDCALTNAWDVGMTALGGLRSKRWVLEEGGGLAE